MEYGVKENLVEDTAGYKTAEEDVGMQMKKNTMQQASALCAILFLLSIGLWGCGEMQDTVGTAAAESSEKQELILAGIDFDASLISAVTTFNQTSNDTVVTLRDYGDHSAALSGDTFTRVYKDVVAGDIPDMYIMTSASLWSIDAMVAQGAFADLYPFLEDDPTISRDDFFSTILETVRQDDALFYFPVSYALKGIWGLPEYGGDSNRFPIDRISELRRRYPGNDMLFGDLSSMDLIRMELSQNQDLYINRETRACDFTSERFLHVLEAACHLPNFRPSGREEMMDYATGVYLLEGRQLFAPYTVADFEAYLMMTVGVEGEAEVVFNPYSTDMVSMTLTNSEVVLDIRSAFAISSTCSDPASAWQFLSTFLEQEYQQSLPTATAPALPVNIHAFTAETDRLLAEGKGTDSVFSRILQLIESAKAVSSTDIQIESMVHEEVLTCFSGEKTAEEAARMIQDRVSTYLEEY